MKLRWKVRVGTAFQLCLSLDNTKEKKFSWPKLIGGTVAVALISATVISLGYGMATGDYIPLQTITDYIKELIGVVVKNTS